MFFAECKHYGFLFITLSKVHDRCSILRKSLLSVLKKWFKSPLFKLLIVGNI